MNKLHNDIIMRDDTTRFGLLIYVLFSFGVHTLILICILIMQGRSIVESPKVTWINVPLVDEVGGSSNTHVISNQKNERQLRADISNSNNSFERPKEKSKPVVKTIAINSKANASNHVEVKSTKINTKPLVGTNGTSTSNVGIGSGSALYGLSPSIGTSGIIGSISGLDKNFPFLWYIQQIQSRITSNWNRLNLAQGRVQIYFRIKRSGDIIGARIESPSGNNSLDQMALMAVLRSNPLPRLPDAFSSDDLGVRFWFTYINS